MNYERGLTMRRTTLLTAALAIAGVVAAATPAMAMRDPGAGTMAGRGMGLYDYTSKAGQPARIGRGGLNNQYADGLNLYQYVDGNPVIRLDPTGNAYITGGGMFSGYGGGNPNIGEKPTEFPSLPDSPEEFDPGINYYGNHKSKTMADLISRYGRAIRYIDECKCVDKCTVLALIWVESHGDPHAYRYEPGFFRRYLKDKKPWVNNPYYSNPERISSSYGPLQIMYPTAYGLGYRGQPEGLSRGRGIRWGMKYFCKQMKRYGSRKMDAVAAYNAGSARRGSDGSYRNQGYVDKYLSAYNDCVAAGGNKDS